MGKVFTLALDKKSSPTRSSVLPNHCARKTPTCVNQSETKTLTHTTHTPYHYHQFTITMKFTCTQENLHLGLQAVSRIASKNIALPILNNVLLIAESGVVRLQTTNLELGITVTVRAKVEAEGRYTVQSRVLSDFITFLGNEKVTLETTDAGLLVTSGHSTTTIKGLPADEFPVMPKLDEAAVAAVPAGVFQALLDGVLFSASHDESRPEISGVLIRVDGADLTVAATDSYRLAERRGTLSKPTTKTIQVIVPARSAQEISRSLPKTDTEATLHLSDAQINVSLPEVELVSRVIEGQYPDYRQIIPGQMATTTTVSKTELADNIRAASLFCKPGINDLTLRIQAEEKNIIFLAANTQLGDHTSSLPAEVSGPAVDIVFNYRYLLDGVMSLPGEDVSIEVNDANSPGVLRGVGNTQALYLLMPIRQ